MKKLKLAFIVVASMMSLNAISQVNFEWDMIDTTTLDKEPLYNSTKLFILENWKSGKDVIHEDNKEGGLILVKATNEQEFSYQMEQYKYEFTYNVQFRFKEGKYRVIIDNVVCIHGQRTWAELPPVPVGDEYPKNGPMVTRLSKKKYLELMNNLRQVLQDVVDNYGAYLNKENTSNNDW